MKTKGPRINQKQRSDKPMFKIKHKGQEGYFLSEEEYSQFKQTVNSVENILHEVGDSE